MNCSLRPHCACWRRVRHAVGHVSFVFAVLLLLTDISITPVAAADAPSADALSADATLVVGNVVSGDTITSTAIWDWRQSEAPDALQILGIAPAAQPQKPIASLMWVKDNGGWFPVWKLQLQTTMAANSSVTDLTQGLFAPGMQVRVVASYHAKAGLLAIAVYDEAQSRLLYTKALKVAAMAGPFVPIASAGFGADTPVLKSVSAVAGYQPVADRLEIGQVEPDGTFIAISNYLRSDTAMLRIASDAAAPGEYRIAFADSNDQSLQPLPNQQADSQKLIGRISPANKDDAILLPLKDFQPGSTMLVADYWENNQLLYTLSSRIVVGKATFNVGFSGVDREQGTVRGSLQTNAPDALPGVTAQLEATYTPIVWDASSNSYVEAPALAAQPVLIKPIDDLAATSPLPFVVPLPNQPGAWRLSLSVKTTPTVSTSITGAREYVASYSQAEDFDIAATEQATQRIVVFDSAISDWNKPEAVKWTWQPSMSLGYSYADISQWGGPSDVKLRNSAFCGGQCLVATAGSMATIATYPAGQKKWASYVGGNPHAAELLPNGNIAVAASTGGWVRIYASSQGPNSTFYYEYALPGAHGVLWDPQLNVLWAVGDYKLVALKVQGSDSRPTLEKSFEVNLPTNWGHDLYAVYGDPDRLWVTTGSRVYQYVKSRKTFIESYPGADMINRAGVKSIGNQPSGQVVLTQPKEGSLFDWSTDTAQMFVPAETRLRSLAAFYKVRVWWPEYQ